MNRAAEVEARVCHDRILELEVEVEELKAALGFMLSAPWEGGGLTQWSVTLACNLLEHPRIRRESARPCYCGWVKP